MRIIFFAGKGGTGKTSIAAATGIKAAKMGKKTVIMSLDVAHSLSDIFDLDKNLLDQNKGRPLQINSNLYIQEIDIQEEIKRYWADIHRYLSSLFNTTGLDEVLAEELAILPGMEEVSLLLYINQYVQKKEYDVIIIGSGPNGLQIGAYLAKAGQKVLLLEKRVEDGGGLATEQITLPDYFHNTHAVFHMMVDYAPLYQDFPLEEEYNIRCSWFIWFGCNLYII